MTKKYAVTEALRTSGLLTSDRIIVMVFVDLAELESDGDMWMVPEHRTPSLTELAEWTGLGRTTVAARLNALEGTGWVKRARPATADALGRGERTAYWIAIGESVERKRASRPGGGRHGKPSAAAEPVQPLDQVNDGGSATELVQPLNQPSSAVEPDLVQPLNPPSSAVEHKNPPPTGVGSPQSSQQQPNTPTSRPAGRDDRDDDSLPLPIDEPAPAPKPKKRAAYGSPEFDEFYDDAYPRKEDRKKAWKAWQKAIKEGADAAEVIAGARRYRDDPNRSDTYTKHPATWLNAGAWDNGPLPPRGGGTRHQPYRDPTDLSGYYEEI